MVKFVYRRIIIKFSCSRWSYRKRFDNKLQSSWPFCSNLLYNFGDKWESVERQIRVCNCMHMHETSRLTSHPGRHDYKEHVMSSDTIAILSKHVLNSLLPFLFFLSLQFSCIYTANTHVRIIFWMYNERRSASRAGTETLQKIKQEWYLREDSVGFMQHK